MTDRDELPFLSRWSRRKIEAKEADAVAVPAVPAVDTKPAAATAREEGEAVPAVATPAPLPPVDSLHGLASEYGDFLKPGVDESLKRGALKKLFNDPHFSFASMDKLDTYIDDYSVEDPIPEAVLRSLNQSKSLFLFESKKEETERKALASASAPEFEVSRQTALGQPADPAVQPAADAAQPAVSETEPVVPPKPV